MKLKVKIKSSELEYYNTLFTNCLQINFDYIDYAEFYNITKFLKHIADQMYRQNTQPRNEVTLNIDLNEYKTLRKIILISKNFIEQSIFYCVIVTDFVKVCEKQISKIRHNQVIFFDTNINNKIKFLQP
jgi:hypothetical protein